MIIIRSYNTHFHFWKLAKFFLVQTAYMYKRDFHEYNQGILYMN